MPGVVKSNSAKQIRNVSSRSRGPRKRADREETFRICAVQRSRMLSDRAARVHRRGARPRIAADRRRAQRRTGGARAARAHPGHPRSRRRPRTQHTKARETPPPLTAEGIVGAVLSVIHARLLDRLGRRRNTTNGSSPHATTVTHDPLTDLSSALTAMVVAPYLGKSAATKELACPAPRPSRTAKAHFRRHDPSSEDPLQGLDMRLTYRTLRVLTAIATEPGISNRKVADAAGIHDQGQISKLLARLERLGLAHNTGDGQPRGEPNAWTLTRRGSEVATAIEAQQL
jgi:hypothetical protein